MRKKKFVCGIALCLALSVAGCGKDSKEQQAANYYQNQLGMDKEDAQDLAHELYGDNDEVGSPYEEAPGNTEVEPLPEFLNSEWYEQKVQIYDMIFSNDMHMTEADIRAAVEGSSFDVELREGFDNDGNIVPLHLYINGELRANFVKNRYTSGYRKGTYDAEAVNIDNLVNAGLVDSEDFYMIIYGDYYPGPNIYSPGIWYDKGSTEFANLKTRDDVLAYLTENSFVEVEQEEKPGFSDHSELGRQPWNKEFADTSHYVIKGMQSVELYRVHRLSETDQVVDKYWSGGHLNLVNCVTFYFNTDGTVNYISWKVDYSLIRGEYIE